LDRLDTQSAKEENTVPEYVRVTDFEADEAALDALVSEINSHDGPPEGVPAKAINVLTNRAGKVRVVVFFGSEEDLRKGGETLDAMSPPEDASMRRTSVETFEIVLQKKAP
jgi:hypothetical protein